MRIHTCRVHAYLRLLVIFPAILIPDCASSSLVFCMIYSVYKLNKQGDNIQPWHVPIPIWSYCCSMSGSNCCFLSCIQISLEMEMATHSSILAWKIPWMEEIGGLEFMGLERVRHDWATNIEFSGGRSGGLLFPSLEFSIVFCDSHSQRLWYS